MRCRSSSTQISDGMVEELSTRKRSWVLECCANDSALTGGRELRGIRSVYQEPVSHGGSSPMYSSTLLESCRVPVEVYRIKLRRELIPLDDERLVLWISSMISPVHALDEQNIPRGSSESASFSSAVHPAVGGRRQGFMSSTSRRPFCSRRSVTG